MGNLLFVSNSNEELVCLMPLSIECGLNGTCHQKPEGPVFSVIHPTLSTRNCYHI